LHTLVADHVVQGRIIFPGAGYFEMARAAAASSAAGSGLRGVFFLQPLAVEAADVIECALAEDRFKVRSGDAAGDTALPDEAAVHCSGSLATDSAGGRQRPEHALVRGVCAHVAASVAALYAGFDAMGLMYGPGYRTLVQAWGGSGAAAARLQARSAAQGLLVHPADLDDALCLGNLASSGSASGETRLPFAVDGAVLQGGRGELSAVRRTSWLDAHDVCVGLVWARACARG